MTKTKGSSTPWLFLCLFLCVAVLGGSSYFLWRYLSGQADYEEAAAKLDAEVAKAKEVGVPLVAKDLAPDPPVRDDENAATLYLKAGYAATGKGGNTSVIELAHEAAGKPKCDFARDWDLGPALLFPDLARAKNVAKILAADADGQAVTGNHDAAISDLRAIVAIGNDAASDPIIISELVSIACQSIMLRSAERCIDSATDVATLKKYEAFFDAGPPNVDVVRLLKGESYIGTTTMRNLRAFGVNNRNVDAFYSPTASHIDSDMLQRSGMPTNLKDRAYLARHLENWNTILGKKNEVRSPRQLFMIAASVMQSNHGPHKPSYDLDQMLAPVYISVGTVMDRNDASWQVTRALVKARIYKLQNGRYPDSLKEIAFSESDPFSGQSYRYISDGRSVRIYSIGPDRIDDHGLRSQEMAVGNQSKGDLAASDPPLTTKPPKPAKATMWWAKPKPKAPSPKR